MTQMKSITGFLALAMAAWVCAPASASAENMYLEGNIGLTMVSDVDTKAYSATSKGVTFTDFRANIDYDNAMSYGGEIGLKNENARFGLGINRFEASFDAVGVSGTATDGTDTLSTNTSYTRDQVINVAGLSFDNAVTSYFLNGYYDFDTGGHITPYIGMGIGLVDIEHAKDIEIGVSGTVGANFDINDKFYFGIKGKYYWIQGPTDSYGMAYDDFSTMEVSGVIGFRL